MKSLAKNIGSGFLIGFGMLVPGVSGGTIAIILGIYENILSAVGDFFLDIKRNFTYLFGLAVGGLLGFFSMAKVVSFLLERYYLFSMYFFMGVVLGGVLFLCRHTDEESPKVKIVPVLVGIIIVVLFQLLPTEMMRFDSFSFWIRFLLFIVAGLILAAALILPGISFSLMLMVLGLYSEFLTAVENFDLRFLLPICFAVLFGIIVLTKAIIFFLKRAPDIGHSLILGFVLASLFELFPGIPKEGELIGALLLLFSGFCMSFGSSVLCKSEN